MISGIKPAVRWRNAETVRSRDGSRGNGGYYSRAVEKMRKRGKREKEEKTDQQDWVMLQSAKG